MHLLRIFKRLTTIQIANYLESGNRAIAGDEVSIQEAIKLASTPSFKARMAKKLSVSGAFHTEYMRVRTCFPYHI